MPKVRQICCIPNCGNTHENTKTFSPPLRFYKFPTEESSCATEMVNKRQRWIHAIGLKNKDGSVWQPPYNSYICSAHFVGGVKCDNPLSLSSVPSIFPKSRSENAADISIAEDTVASSLNINNISSNMFNTDENIVKICCTPDIDMGEGQSLKEPDVCDTDTAVKVLKKNIGCQVDLRLLEQSGEMNCFICNMWVKDDICHAQVQVNISNKVERNVDLQKSRDITCGSSSDNQQEFKITGFQGLDSIRNNCVLLDLCGVTFYVFDMLLSFLPKVSTTKLSNENRLLICLMKLKLGISNAALAVLFNVDRSTILRVFKSIMQRLPLLVEEHIHWPSKEMIEKTLPPSFITSDLGNCRVMIDCIETQTETAAKPEQRSLNYPFNKSVFSIKFLIGFAPNGFICFKSRCYDVRTKDIDIVRNSEFFKFIEPGDIILANREFCGINTDIENAKAKFITGPYLTNSDLWPSDVESAYQISSVHNHFTRCIKRIKAFRILSFISKDILYETDVDSIVHVCCALANLQ